MLWEGDMGKNQTEFAKYNKKDKTVMILLRKFWSKTIIEYFCKLIIY